MNKIIPISHEVNIWRNVKPSVSPSNLQLLIFFSKVKTINEKLTIGKISKYWSGFVNDVFTNADNFGIHVPADLDVTVKAAMIGACFLFVSAVLKSKGDLFLSFSLVDYYRANPVLHSIYSKE